MLIVTENPSDMANLDFIDKSFMVNAHHAGFDDLRWHRLRLINHDLIVLLPGAIDISYHLKYLSMASDASIIVITDNQDNIARKYSRNLIVLKPPLSRDFFSGSLTTLIQQHQRHKVPVLEFINTLNTAKFVLNHIRQVAPLSRAIAKASLNTPQLRRGIYELLLNAFEHGVYQLGFDLKHQLIADKQYFAELNRRLRDPAFKGKSIELSIYKKEEGTYINITDPGLGFDYKPYLTVNKNLSDAKSGRGIAYAANYCFDQLIYKNEGRSVFAVLSNQGKALKPL
ncbi:hypothetical protein [Legionella erythra]|uniref:Histidine kinase/HSP90-like ATPase domain-containing protein n=1 Tax=Legionella erythra TaxID=448 RepID=A0A0W0TS51_LEGER|nr:hypothetical protein [Legionella erythra]KTC98390.1 hypothetical protein Lery_0953 [Legionella erythra]